MAHLWMPQVSPISSLDFTGRGKFFMGEKHLGQPFSICLCIVAAALSPLVAAHTCQEAYVLATCK